MKNLTLLSKQALALCRAVNLDAVDVYYRDTIAEIGEAVAPAIMDVIETSHQFCKLFGVSMAYAGDLGSLHNTMSEAILDEIADKLEANGLRATWEAYGDVVVAAVSVLLKRHELVGNLDFFLPSSIA